MYDFFDNNDGTTNSSYTNDDNNFNYQGNYQWEPDDRLTFGIYNPASNKDNDDNNK